MFFLFFTVRTFFTAPFFYIFYFFLFITTTAMIAPAAAAKTAISTVPSVPIPLFCAGSSDAGAEVTGIVVAGASVGCTVVLSTY